MRLRVCIFFLLISQISIAKNCDVDQIKDLLQNQQYAIVYSMAETMKDVLYIIDNSTVDYLYIPEHARMVHREDNKNKHKKGYADNSIFVGSLPYHHKNA